MRPIVLSLLLLLVLAAPAGAAITEPNGTTVPVDSDNGEQQLYAFFANHGEPIDWQADAQRVTDPVYLPGDGTITVASREGDLAAGLGWYNAGADPTSPGAIHELIAIDAPTGTVVSAKAIHDDPAWVGGKVAFALLTSASQSMPADPVFGVLCSGCNPPGSWITALTYASKLDPSTRYLAFEDTRPGSEPSSFNNDGDFNDDVFALTGVARHCADSTDDDGDGVADRADRGCYSGPDGAYAPGDDDESDDPAPPAIALDQPAQDATTLSAAITSPGTGAASCVLALDGQALATSRTGNRCTADVPAAVEPGSHAVVVTYTETAGSSVKDAGSLKISMPPAPPPPVDPPPPHGCATRASVRKTIATIAKGGVLRAAEVRRGKKRVRRFAIRHGRAVVALKGLKAGRYTLRLRVVRHHRARWVTKTFRVCG